MTNEVRARVSTPGAKQSTKEITDLRGAFSAVQAQGAKGIGLGDTAKYVGLGAAIGGVGLAIHGVTGFIGESLEAASDLNESVSKSRVIFGDASDDMEEFGEQAAESFGMSKQAAVEAGATFGNFFTGVGVGQEKAEDMSETLVGLAGDLASFNNLDPTEALDKLRAGLAGESEPLRRVGVFMTEAKVKAKALEMGLGDAHGELTEGEKILARYQIILDETKTAQGDFARTADGAANSQRTLNAELENAQAKLGEELLPTQQAVTGAQIDFFRGINAVADAVNFENKSLEEQIEILDSNGVIAATWTREQRAAGIATLQAAIAARDAAAAEETHGDALIGVRAASKAAIGPTSDLTGGTEDLAKAAEDAEREIGDLADTISDELFGEAINRGNLAQLRETHDELVDQRDEVEKGTRKWRILTGEIAENEQAQFDLQLQMKEKEGPQAVIDWLRKQKELFGDESGAIQKLIDKYKALAAIQGGVISAGSLIVGSGAPQGGNQYGGGKRRRARGGPVQADTAYIVGEEGQELFVPDQAGRIIPNAGPGTPMSMAGRDWGSGGGMAGAPATAAASTVININISTPVLTPGAAQELARHLEPIITRQQQRQGLLAGARAF